MKTTALRTQDIEQKWYILDCTGKKLGRLSVQVANILRGKNKPEYTPNSDVGDFVILLNAKNIEVTGKKATDKIYYRHSGFPGGIKQISFQDQMEKNPEKVPKEEQEMKKLFLSEFSTLLEMVAPSPGHLLITDDFNFHMNVCVMVTYMKILKQNSPQ